MPLIPSALTAFKATLSTQSKDLISKNKNSNENNSTLRKASVDTTTSPGAPQVTVPQATATAPSVGSETGPSPPGISAEDKDKDRDARAYEHERQRAKHAGEWAKRRARKATKGVGVGRASAVHAGRAKGRKGGSDVDVDVSAVIPQGRNAESPTDGLGAGVLKGVSLPPNRDSGKDASKAVKVNLSEIMVLSQRKLRKLNGTFPQYYLEETLTLFFSPVDDFEVIPHIRSVIALDDVDNVHDMDFDEPWEHIYGEEKVSEGKFGRPSYARVAGTGCQ